MARAMNSGAMVSIISDGAVDLVVGPNEIDITVTAEDRLPASMKHYQVIVTRAGSGASTNATLGTLTVDTSSTEDANLFMDLDKKFEHSIELPFSIDDQDTAMSGDQGTLVATPSENTSDSMAVVTVENGQQGHF